MSAGAMRPPTANLVTATIAIASPPTAVHIPRVPSTATVDSHHALNITMQVLSAVDPNTL
ncbi:hypothetical protein TorRG33x02_304980 [Trema orientale]|uniref:Uncharacterized protein n=1 Tax=Trema orientale TaxID=63057 RepID=A0A2P5BXW4_TREOI|nr:hypothetical protein TorRG33x02_304980 [Trema orientale]